MSIRIIIKILAGLFFLGLSAFILIILLYISGGGSHARYYSNLKNYISIDGIITSLNQSDDGTIYLVINSEDHAGLPPLKIIPKNAVIARANGLMLKTEVGDTVSLITSLAYFGDGYVLPIVGITHNSIEYLGSPAGVSNQVAYERSKIPRIFWPLIIPGSLTIYFWVSLFLGWLAKRKNDNTIKDT